MFVPREMQIANKPFESCANGFKTNDVDGTARLKHSLHLSRRLDGKRFVVLCRCDEIGQIAIKCVVVIILLSIVRLRRRRRAVVPGDHDDAGARPPARTRHHGSRTGRHELVAERGIVRRGHLLLR